MEAWFHARNDLPAVFAAGRLTLAATPDGQTKTPVILRCSPFFTASLEGWATSACGHPSRRAQERAPQDDGGVGAAIQGWWARDRPLRVRPLCPPYGSS